MVPVVFQQIGIPADPVVLLITPVEFVNKTPDVVDGKLIIPAELIRPYSVQEPLMQVKKVIAEVSLPLSLSAQTLAPIVDAPEIGG
jgi:hypothetical protein